MKRIGHSVLVWMLSVVAVFGVGVQAVGAQSVETPGVQSMAADAQSVAAMDAENDAENEAVSEAEKASYICRKLQASLNAPYYFCDCRESASTFAFPLTDQIADTVWYTASVDDLRKGLTAYWFADCSVTIEVRALCSSETPTISMTVGKDQMREMDAAGINQKIDEMGEVAGELLSTLTPHIRVYPNGKCSGKVYVFPYNEGPHSTCEATLPVRTSMTYVSNHADDVYEWEADRLPSSGAVFVQWKEQKNNPCEVWVTRGSCSGTEVARTTLADSTKLFFPDKQLIQSAKKAGESLFFHFAHSSDKVGRIRFRTNPKFVSQVTDTTICQGMGLQLADTLLTQTTLYTNDTTWLRGDTIAVRAYNLTVDAPQPQRDTLRVKSKELPMLYRNQEYIPRGGYGDYDLTIHTAGACDERYLLSVEHRVEYTDVAIDTTLCEGKTLTVGGVAYSRDTTIQSEGWIDEDTYARMDIRIEFSAPETEYDTVYVSLADLSGDGYYYAAANAWIEAPGDYTYTVRRKNQCTRVIELAVREQIESGLTKIGTDKPISHLFIAPDGTIFVLREGKKYTLLGQEK